MAGKLLQVASTTVTTSVSTIDFSTKITDNNVYQLSYTNIIPSSDGANFNFRVTKSSDNSADSTSNYDRNAKNLRANTTFSDTTGNNASEMTINIGGNSTGESLSGTINLYNFFDSNLYSMGTVRAVGRINDGNCKGFTGAFWHTVAQSNNGISLFFAAGTIDSGSAVLYKVLP